MTSNWERESKQEPQTSKAEVCATPSSLVTSLLLFQHFLDGLR